MSRVAQLARSSAQCKRERALYKKTQYKINGSMPIRYLFPLPSPHQAILCIFTLYRVFNSISLQPENFSVEFMKRFVSLVYLSCTRWRSLIKRWKPMSKRPIGRPKLRWEDDILGDIKSMNVCNWMNVAQNRDRWKKVVEQARTLNRL